MSRLLSVLVVLMSVSAFAQSNRLCSFENIDFVREVVSRCNLSIEDLDEEYERDVQPECMRYIMDKGYGPSTAKETCLNIKTGNFQCLKFSMGKGYGPSTAKAACEGIGRKEYACYQFVMSKGYSPTTARDTCKGVTKAQGQCIQDIMNRGYGPSGARQNCL